MITRLACLVVLAAEPLRAADPSEAVGLWEPAQIRHTEAESVRAAERQRLQALVAANMAVADRLHAPDFHVINPLGLTATKDQYLKYVADGTVDYMSWEPGPIEVRMQGRLAAIRYWSVVEVIVRGERSRRRAWNTGIYELRDRRWQIVWFQVTQIAGPTA